MREPESQVSSRPGSSGRRAGVTITPPVPTPAPPPPPPPSATTPPPPPATYVPEAPTNLTAQAVSSGADFNKVELRWSLSCVNTPCVSSETKVYRRLAGGAWDWAYIGSAGADATLSTDSHFPNGTYEYRINVCNAYGCSPNSNLATITVTVASTGTIIAPRSLASVLDAIARVLAALGEEIKRLR